MSIPFIVALTFFFAYFLGCFNGAVIISHFIIGDDVRNHGSGNAGLTNFYRTYGAKYALPVILCDMLKTAISAEVGFYIFQTVIDDGILGMLVGGLGCVLGHMFPVFYGFKGGKGILSGGMLVILLGWRTALIAWGLFLILAICTRYVSLGSIAAASSMPFTMMVIHHFNPLYTVLSFCIAGLVVWCHRSNIQRLLSGTEKKFTFHKSSEDGGKQ